MVAGNLARKMNTTPEPKVHISESPVKWCSVSLSDMVSRGKRLEAGSFDIEAKAAEKAIIDCKYGCVKFNWRHCRTCVSCASIQKKLCNKNASRFCWFFGQFRNAGHKTCSSKIHYKRAGTGIESLC